MELAFEIAGHRCVADRIAMKGRTLEADFSADAKGALVEAKERHKAVTFLGVPYLTVTYCLERFEMTGANTCKAIFAVNSSADRAVH